jgi:hypothetical protein
MKSEFKELTMNGSWQLVSTAGIKSFFLALQTESISTNTNPVFLRREAGGVERTLTPGDIDTITAPQEWKEPLKDNGIAVKGTATDVVKFEQILFDYQ